MHYFYVFNIKKHYKLTLIIALSLFAAIFILLGQVGSYSIFSKNKQAALTKGSVNDSHVALTFNISWGEDKVFDILKVLEKHQVRATFFVSGEWAEKHPQILEAITEQSHELGMLGYRYKSYLNQEVDEVKKDLILAKTTFKKLGYDEIKLVRPPNGLFNKTIITVIEQLGLQAVHWSINSNDWQNPGVEKVVETILDNIANGDIILLHASDSAKETAESLDTLLPLIKKEKELSFFTISELFNQTSAKEKLID